MGKYDLISGCNWDQEKSLWVCPIKRKTKDGDITGNGAVLITKELLPVNSEDFPDTLVEEAVAVIKRRYKMMNRR